MKTNPEDSEKLDPEPRAPFKYCACGDGKNEIVFERREYGCDCSRDFFYCPSCSQRYSTGYRASEMESYGKPQTLSWD